MAGPENLLPVPFNDEQGLKPSERRPLSSFAQRNITRHEVGSLILLTQPEAQQISFWTNNAALAISQIMQVLATLPGETTTAAEEKRTISFDEQSTREQKTNTRIIGLFTFFNVKGGLDETQSQRTTTSVERSSKQVATTRPGQFLTGGQIKDALGRVAIAREEGLYFFPAHSSELNRRQLPLLQITRRLLEDHKDSNPNWAEDIQEGTIHGLINQLEQTGEAIRKGYLSEDVRSEISENARETIKEELEEDLQMAFTSLLQFSLLEGGKTSVLERAGEALKNCVLNDLYQTDPAKTIKFLNTWLELFSRYAQGKNARIIGTSYAEALTTCILKQQDNESENLFNSLSNSARQTAEQQPGGAAILLNTAINQSYQTPPNNKTLSLLSNLAEHLENRDALEYIISLIRFSVFKRTDDIQDEVTLGLLKKFSWVSRHENDKFHVVNGVIDLPFSIFPKLVLGLTPDEWQKVKEIVNQKGGSWNAKPQVIGEKSNLTSVDLKDPEVEEAIKSSFEAQIKTLIEDNNRLGEKGLDSRTLKYMYVNCSEEAKERLTLALIQRGKINLPEAIKFLKTNMPQILKLASSKSLVKETSLRYYGSLSVTVPDPELYHHINDINDLTPTRGQIFSERPFPDQLKTIYKIFERLEQYRSVIDSKKFQNSRLRKLTGPITKSPQEYEKIRDDVLQLEQLTSVIFNVSFY